MCRFTYKSYICGHADPRQFQTCSLAHDTGRECLDENDRPFGLDRIIPQHTVCRYCQEFASRQGQQGQAQQHFDEAYHDRPRCAYPASHLSAASEAAAPPEDWEQSDLHNAWPGQSEADLSRGERIADEQAEHIISSIGSLISEETFEQRQARHQSELEEAQQQLEEALQWEREVSFPRLIAQSEADLAWHNEQAIQRAIQLSLQDAHINKKSLDEYFNELRTAEEASAREVYSDDEALHQARLASIQDFAKSIHTRGAENLNTTAGSHIVPRVLRIGYRACSHVAEYTREAEYPGQPLPKIETRDGVCDRCQEQDTAPYHNDGIDAAMGPEYHEEETTRQQESDEVEKQLGSSIEDTTTEVTEPPQGAGTAARDHWRSHPSQPPAQVQAVPISDTSRSQQQYAQVPVEPAQALQTPHGLPSAVSPHYGPPSQETISHPATPSNPHISTRSSNTVLVASSQTKDKEDWTSPPLRSPSPVATIRTAKSNREAEESERIRLYAQRLEQLGDSVDLASDSQSEAPTSPAPSVTTGGRPRRQRRLVVPSSLLRDAQAHTRAASSASSTATSTAPSTVRPVGLEAERTEQQTSQLGRSLQSKDEQNGR